MKTKAFLIALTLAALHLGAADPQEGIVNFANCVTDSKLGKQEQASFEATRKQFFTLLEDTDKQIKDLTAKLQDKDTLDGLSPEAEQEMKSKVEQLNQELYHYNQQYNQFISQGQYRFVQAIMSGAIHAAEKIASAKGYTKIANKDAYLYYSPSLDITSDVVKEMDKTFEEETKKQAAATSPVEPPKPETPVDAKDATSTR